MLNYYKMFPDESGYIYSLDMVRLSIDFGQNSQALSDYMKHLLEYDTSVEVLYFPCFSEFKYRHLWNIKIPDTDCSFSVGLNLGNSPNKGFMEFNPNKCEQYDKFFEISAKIYRLSVVSSVVRYDLAIDIPLRRENVKLIRERGKNYEFFVKMDGVTEYLGRRSNNGFVKVYDKREESSLDYDLTRVEITLDRQTFLENVFPTIYLYDEQFQMLLSDNLSSTQTVLVEMLRQCDNPNMFLSRLSRNVKKKIAPYLADRVLLPDLNCFRSVKKLALSYEK